MTITPTTMASGADGGPNKDHILIFPFMAKGHTFPLLHFAAALAERGLRVTLITTPANSASISSLLRRHSTRVEVITLPFPTLPPLPSGCESTDSLPSFDLYPVFLQATALLRPAFHNLLLSLSSSGNLPLCVVSDFFLGWTLDVCSGFGVPRIVFHGMCAFSMFLCKALWTHRPHDAAAAGGEPFGVPGAPKELLLTCADVPPEVRNSGDPGDPVTRFIGALGPSEVTSWGVLVNSFADIERGYVPRFESFFRAGTRAWLVGPMSLLPRDGLADGGAGSAAADECLRWLDARPAGSVAYVSFGTQAHVSDAQLEEVGHGLDAAGCEYLWVVRSPTFAPPENTGGKRGKIVPWAPQVTVLAHPAVGGFVSHCGWNSCLESVAAGVPVLAWPMIAEQFLNAKLLVDVHGAGIRMAAATSDEVVGREEIAKSVKELMAGDQGRRARKRMAKLRLAASSAVEKDGLSHETLDELLEELRWSSNNNKREETKEEVTMDLDALLFDLKDGIRIA